jgi:hypothetical protein
MRIHYTLDDAPARLPLAMRSVDAVWDRAADLRSSPGVHLIEATTQHMLNTGMTLVDELAHYFDEGAPTEADPYGLADCYARRRELEDLLRDLRDTPGGLTALSEVTELFPLSFTRDLQFTLALTVVGYPAFGYARAYSDSDGEEYHGMVANLAQARPHLEARLGQFSGELLVNMIRYGFFNHEGFLLAYAEYSQDIQRKTETIAERLKDTLMSRGIAWYLSYRHNAAFYDTALGLDAAQLPEYIARLNAMLADAGKKRATDDSVFDEWFQRHEEQAPCVDVVGYLAARGIVAARGEDGLRAAVERGADHFIAIHNALDQPPIRARG